MLSSGRLTTGIKIGGTKSFRLACSQLLGIWGTNLQNPPEALLRCCHPPVGEKYLQTDQSGAESLVVAHEAEYGRYRQLVEEGIKPHVYVALHIFIDKFRDKHPRDRYFNRSPQELKSLPEWKELVKRIKSSEVEYALGKMTNHARSYKMKWPTFMLNVLAQTDGEVVLSIEDAKRFLNTWDSLFPEVISWQDRTELKLKDSRTLYNLFGARREFYGKMNDALVREAISWVPQSSVGEITHIAYINMARYIEANSLPWKLLGQKHDSYLQSVPIDQISAAAIKQKEFIEIFLTSTTGVKYRMMGETSAGTNLAKYKPDSNPDGMKEL